jgi:hypothetical protein
MIFADIERRRWERAPQCGRAAPIDKPQFVSTFARNVLLGALIVVIIIEETRVRAPGTLS